MPILVTAPDGRVWRVFKMDDKSEGRDQIYFRDVDWKVYMSGTRAS